MAEAIQNQFFDGVISKINSLDGIDCVYFLDDNYQVVKQGNIKDSSNYLKQIINIIKSEPVIEKVGRDFCQKPFHTYTLLNENGLIVISKLCSEENLYMVVIAGESEPVDLINLLKICKECRISFGKLLKSDN